MRNALLLAEPEPGTRDYLRRQLAHDGFHVVGAAQGEVLEVAERSAPDVVVLGAPAQASHALDVCTLLRAGAPGRTWNPRVPVILVGAECTDAVDRVRALDRGVDDVVARPVVYEELLARIRALLRRSLPQGVLEVGPLRVDRDARRADLAGVRVHLSWTELELLWRLASDPERVFTRAELNRDVLGARSYTRSRSLETHASRLRRKLAAAGGEPWIVNVWGVGYRLRE